MAINKKQKGEIIDAVKELLSKSKSVALVNFHKLTVQKTTEIRKELRSKNLGYYVAKKTLAKRAFADAKIEGETPSLDGELALVYGDDLLAPAREIYAFQKKMDGQLSILGGIFDGVFKNKEEMVSIASIPPQEVLYAQFLNVINSPIQGLVIALNAIAEKKA